MCVLILHFNLILELSKKKTKRKKERMELVSFRTGHTRSPLTSTKQKLLIHTMVPHNSYLSRPWRRRTTHVGINRRGGLRIKSAVPERPVFSVGAEQERNSRK